MTATDDPADRAPGSPEIEHHRFAGRDLAVLEARWQVQAENTKSADRDESGVRGVP